MLFRKFVRGTKSRKCKEGTGQIFEKAPFSQTWFSISTFWTCRPVNLRKVWSPIWSWARARSKWPVYSARRKSARTRPTRRLWKIWKNVLTFSTENLLTELNWARISVKFIVFWPCRPYVSILLPFLATSAPYFIKIRGLFKELGLLASVHWRSMHPHGFQNQSGQLYTWPCPYGKVQGLISPVQVEHIPEVFVPGQRKQSGQICEW